MHAHKMKIFRFLALVIDSKQTIKRRILSKNITDLIFIKGVVFLISVCFYQTLLKGILTLLKGDSSADVSLRIFPKYLRTPIL